MVGISNARPLGQGGGNAKVAGGLMQALDEHPPGLAGVMDHSRRYFHII